MPKRQETPEDREAQFQAFVGASRELECDEDPEAFKGIVRKVVGAPRAEPLDVPGTPSADKPNF